MPIVTISMYSGRTQREKDRLSEAITEDVANIKSKERRGNYSISRSTPWKLVFLGSSSIILHGNS
jgi:4-oxalocrotonate tautomerase